VESQGMLCSARELKLSEDHSGLMILPEDTPIGQDIRKTLNLDDTVFEIKLTPNKADCLSVFGVARETSAITGAPLRPLEIKPANVTLDETLPVKISAPDLCGRFSGRVIRGVNAHAKSPHWMVERLERSGQRSISALVDISNYVMLELGRPSHVFDLDKIHGGMGVRWGRKGETLKLLNGNTVELDETVGVIADDHQVESLAGIMGGDSTAVSLETANIYLEAAFWWPDSIRGRARKYNFSTDAAHRFERGVDYSTTVEHIERISQLILDICGGNAGPVDDQTLNVPTREPVSMRVSRANRIIPPLEWHGPLTWFGGILQVQRWRYFPGVFVEFRQHFLDALPFPVRLIVFLPKDRREVAEFVTHGQVRIDDGLPVVDQQRAAKIVHAWPHFLARVGHCAAVVAVKDDPRVRRRAFLFDRR